MHITAYLKHVQQDVFGKFVNKYRADHTVQLYSSSTEWSRMCAAYLDKNALVRSILLESKNVKRFLLFLIFSGPCFPTFFDLDKIEIVLACQF